MKWIHKSGVLKRPAKGEFSTGVHISLTFRSDTGRPFVKRKKVVLITAVEAVFEGISQNEIKYDLPWEGEKVSDNRL